MMRKRKGWYLTYMGCYRRFGTTYRSHCKGTIGCPETSVNTLQSLTLQGWRARLTNGALKITLKTTGIHTPTSLSYINAQDPSWILHLSPSFPPERLAQRSIQHLGLLQDEFPGISRLQPLYPRVKGCLRTCWQIRSSLYPSSNTTHRSVRCKQRQSELKTISGQILLPLRNHNAWSLHTAELFVSSSSSSSYLSWSWATCWPVPLSRIQKSIQGSAMIPSARWGVVFHYPG